jgi:NADH:ubiquinone oxidoreductase subunit 3 (subunit A)
VLVTLLLVSYHNGRECQVAWGVGNLHGWSSILGLLMSILFVTFDSDAEFLQYDASTVGRNLGGLMSILFVTFDSDAEFLQMMRQLLGAIAALVVLITSG